MRIIDIESINQAMNNETQFVQRCEEVFHDKVASAASTILAGGRERRIVALTGPSGSGKTTTAMRLRDYLENLGVKVCLLSMDNFFLLLEKRPPEATDWESPYCVNVELLLSCIGRLLDGKLVTSRGTTSKPAPPAATSPCRATRTPSSSPRASTCSTR